MTLWSNFFLINLPPIETQWVPFTLHIYIQGQLFWPQSLLSAEWKYNHLIYLHKLSLNRWQSTLQFLPHVYFIFYLQYNVPYQSSTVCSKVSNT